MQAWMGNVIGSAIGLLAILLGAMWNAHLTRRRDKSLRLEEIAAFKGAISAELSVALELTAGKFAQVVLTSGDLPKNTLVSLKPAPLIVWPKLCEKLGWLEVELSQDVVKAFGLLEWHMSVLRAMVDESIEGDHDRRKNIYRNQLFAQDVPGIRKAILSLGGKPPNGLLFPEFGV